MRAWRTVILERVMGCTLNDLADTLHAVQRSKWKENPVENLRDASPKATAMPVAAAAATKRTCQWAAHAEKRRRQLKLAAVWGAWMMIVGARKKGR
jgi:hypothetical protein